MTIRDQKWTNPSVLQFAGDRNPVSTIIQHAREIVIDAIDAGWAGPPFDPLELADYLKLEVVARDDVRDARTVPIGRSQLHIEFNPNRPRGRVRFSLAHEIAHTLFPDCASYVRNRGEHLNRASDEWQLEALCNIAAAEFLMPAIRLPQFREQYLSIDSVIALRSEFDVSAEALLIRIADITDEPCAVFCASPLDQDSGGQYRIDYTIQSRTWIGTLPPPGTRLLPTTLISQCAGIGYTAKGNEGDDIWGTVVHVESLGIPPYPGSDRPRVAGILVPLSSSPSPKDQAITFLRGNALEPRGLGSKIIVHVVNDRARVWGGKGFAPQVRKKWPEAQQEFRKWATSRDSLELGNVHFVNVASDTTVGSMICQYGYGPSQVPRIRYAALNECLSKVAQWASENKASVHMPRIGSGQSGGKWEIVQEIVSASLSSARIPAFVYDLPRSQGGWNQRSADEHQVTSPFGDKDLGLESIRSPAR